jgi:hypothetical protein
VLSWNRRRTQLPLEVDDFDGVIAQGRHEETVAVDVDRQMVNPTFHGRQRDPSDHLQ